MATEDPTATQPTLATDLYQFENADVWAEDDESARLQAYFPLTPGMPNASGIEPESLMMVCLEIAPGDHLPIHTDSNEELLIVTQGTVEASIGDRTVELDTGSCAVVPKMAPHGMRNVGDEPARVLGIFPDTDVTATFETALMPFETNVVTIGGDDQGA